MKKILSVIISAVFIAVMVLNIEINAKAGNENDIRLKNVEALAYIIIEDGMVMGSCSFPWWETCWVVNLYTTLPGYYHLP